MQICSMNERVIKFCSDRFQLSITSLISIKLTICVIRFATNGLLYNKITIIIDLNADIFPTIKRNHGNN